MELINIKNLNKTFKNKIVLDNFSWQIHEGEVWALVGSNGSGKTTLMSILVGLGDADSGEIIYNYSYKKHFSEKIGFLFQKSSYPKILTTSEIISIFEKTYDFDKNEFTKLVNLLEINSILNKKVKVLSGGELQKLNLLFTFLNKPSIIILDEFSTNLDIRSKINVRNYLLKYIKENNATAIIVSHDIDEIVSICNRVIHIETGKIVNLILEKNQINPENITKLFLDNKIQ